MGLFSVFGKNKGKGLDLAELARRLDLTEAQLLGTPVEYTTFPVPKRSGGSRTIDAPNPELKRLQRRILRRLLALLVSHPAVTGFERGRSIVHNALPHARQAVVLRFDLKDFFNSTSAKRVEGFFRKIGWNKEVAAWLAKVCTLRGGLPQGAPTSPRLANLVNFGLDLRLERLARKFGAVYTRYADDLTFSLAEDRQGEARRLAHFVRLIVQDEGYRLNKRKGRIRRQHQQQRVTGLIVNDTPNLPRETRRRLRAIEHAQRLGRTTTLTPEQLRGWQALRTMIDRQRQEGVGE
jgi:RNA-directed DNA polymerase